MGQGTSGLQKPLTWNRTRLPNQALWFEKVREGWLGEQGNVKWDDGLFGQVRVGGT